MKMELLAGKWNANCWVVGQHYWSVRAKLYLELTGAKGYPVKQAKKIAIG